MEMILDKKAFIEWLEMTACFAFSDLSKSIKDGNIDAAQAHLERIEMLENIAPWFGEKKAFVGIKLILDKTKEDKVKQFDFLDEKPF